MMYLFHRAVLAARESLIYSYSRSFNGFVAKFLDEEATVLGGEVNINN